MKKIFISLTVLAVVAGVTLFITAKRNQNKRELTAKECGIYKSYLGTRIEILSEKARLGAAGLDVDELKGPYGSDILWVSSSKLDHGQVGCKIEIISGTISSVQ